MIKKIVILLIYLSVHSTAQVNTEIFRKDINTNGLYHTANFFLHTRSGNSIYKSQQVSYRGDYVRNSFRSFLIYRSKYTKTPLQTISNNGFFHLRLTKKLNNTIDSETFFQNEFNDFILLQNRNLIGLSFRKTLVTVKKHTFVSSLGIMYEEESVWNVKQTCDYKFSHFFLYQYSFAEKSYFYVCNYYQPLISNFSDYRLLTDAVLSISLSKHIALKHSLNYRYNSKPPYTVKNYDLELNHGISITF